MLWKERKRLWCRLPWTFTVYKFDEDRIYVEKGLFSKKYDEVRLYRVLDMSVSRSFMQRLFGLGTIQLNTSDQTLGDFELVNITKCLKTKEQLSQLVENQRDKKRVSTREFVGDMAQDISEF